MADSEFCVDDDTVAHIAGSDVAHLLVTRAGYVRTAQERRDLLVAALRYARNDAHACGVVGQRVRLVLVGHVCSVGSIARTLLDVKASNLWPAAADAEAEKR